jgi:hypothetical protein
MKGFSLCQFCISLQFYKIDAVDVSGHLTLTGQRISGLSVFSCFP